MIDVISSSYHLMVLFILGIYGYRIKYTNKRVVLSHAKKAKMSLFALIFSAVTIWIVSLAEVALSDPIQKIMTTFFVLSVALIWLASDSILHSVYRDKFSGKQ